MNIQLNEREVQELSKLLNSSTFKIPESSFLYMKMDVANMTWQTVDEHPKAIKVQIPEGKTPVVCLNTGKAQFLDLKEKVEIVILDVNEIVQEKGE